MASKSELLSWVEGQVVSCRPIALRYFRSASLRVHRKSDRSPVTIADQKVEEKLRRAITKAFPGEAILGEEFGRSGRGTSTYWTIDPIDGTRAFSRGLPSWGILVGRVERGVATLGVCDFPVFGTTIGVAPGVKAYERFRGRRSLLPRARAVRSLQEAVIFNGGLQNWRATRKLSHFVRLAESCYLDRAYGDCYGYLWALRGYVDAVVDCGLKPWDLVPLVALARATGRSFTDFSGRDCFTGPEAVMAHPALNRLICRVLTGRASR